MQEVHAAIAVIAVSASAGAVLGALAHAVTPRKTRASVDRLIVERAARHFNDRQDGLDKTILAQNVFGRRYNEVLACFAEFRT